MDILDFKYDNLSQDYELLFELMQKQRIVCFIKNKEGLEEICATGRKFNKDYISIGTRGIEYISAFDYKDLTPKEDFLKQCKEYQLKFLIPGNNNE